MEYETSDFKTMVFLYAKGYKIKHISDQGRRKVISFVDDGTLKSSVLKFINKEERIEINELFGAQDKVKTLVYERAEY